METQMRLHAVLALIPLGIVGHANAEVTLYYDIQNPAATQQAWMNAASLFTTIDFTGFGANTIITTQYQSQGVTFIDGTDRILFASGFLNDGVGLNGALDESALAFVAPVNSIAVDHPGSVQFRLFDGGSLIYTSPILFSQGLGGFAGLISEEPFDAVQISDPVGGLFIDDLYFGPPIPAPGAIATFAAGAIAGSRRRRSQ